AVSYAMRLPNSHWAVGNVHRMISVVGVNTASWKNVGAGCPFAFCGCSIIAPTPVAPTKNSLRSTGISSSPLSRLRAGEGREARRGRRARWGRRGGAAQRDDLRVPGRVVGAAGGGGRGRLPGTARRNPLVRAADCDL